MPITAKPTTTNPGAPNICNSVGSGRGLSIRGLSPAGIAFESSSGFFICSILRPRSGVDSYNLSPTHFPCTLATALRFIHKA